MDAIDGAAVLARARDGDTDAFQALVEQHSRRVFQLAYKMTGNEQDAEDVVQESFLRAYRQLGRFEARANFGTWLHRIVANCAIDAIRSRQARHRHVVKDTEAADVTQVATSSPTPERLAASEEVHHRIALAMETLSPLERAAFTLRHYEGRSTDEICRLLNVNTSAAKHCVFRAVKKLRAALEPLRS